MSLKKKGSTRKKSAAPIKASSLTDIDRVLAERHERITESGGYRLRTGKVIPVSKDYRKDWILLKDQPSLSKSRRKKENYFYHGTSDIHLDSIKKYGLMISDFPSMGATASSAWDGSTSDMLGKVGLTDHMPNAATYSLHGTLLAEKKGNQLIMVVDRSKLDKDMLYIRKGSGAPPAKEWDYDTGIPPASLVGYWHNIGKVKFRADGLAYLEEAPPEARHKGWVYFSNPKYRGELD